PRRAERAGGRRRCRNDVLVAGAATEIPRDRLANLGRGGIRALAQETGQRHQEPGGAEAALQSVVLTKGFLERIERLTVGEAFDRLDVTAVHLDGEEQTRPQRGASEDDRARATHAVLAAEMRSGQLQIVAEEVGERLPRFHGPLVHSSVDGDANRPLDHRPSPRARSAARASALRVRTPATSFRYSLEACRSLSGRSASETRRLTSSIACGDGRPPTSARAASRARTGVGPTPVSATLHAVHTPASSTVTVVATPTRAKSPCRRLTSRKALPVRRGIEGSFTSTSSSVGSAAVVRYPTKNCSAVSRRRPRALCSTISPPSAATT